MAVQTTKVSDGTDAARRTLVAIVGIRAALSLLASALFAMGTAAGAEEAPVLLGASLASALLLGAIFVGALKARSWAYGLALGVGIADTILGIKSGVVINGGPAVVGLAASVAMAALAAGIVAQEAKSDA